MADKKKKQGYKSRKDESIAMRNKKKRTKKKLKASRDESYGKWGKRGNQKINKAKGGTVKKQHGGMTQGYNARLDESLGARHPGATGSMAGRRAMSQGMESAMGKGPYSGAATIA